MKALSSFLLATLLAALCFTPLGVRAQQAAPAAPDPGQGRVIAQRGLGKEGGTVPACATCHGLHGASDGSGAFPRIAGMSAQYLYKYKQLQDYASGARPHAVMSPIAKAMSEAEPRDVSAYYAAIEDAPYFPPPQVEPQVLRQGAALVAVGSEEKEVQACANCHSPAGRGVPAPSFPYLAGQYAQYIEQQLALFKQGQRHNDPLGVMRDMASRLSEDEVRAISLYFQSVRPSRTMHAAEPQGGEGGPRG